MTGARVVQPHGDLPGRGAHGDGDHDATGVDDGEPGGHEVRAVGAHEAHALPRAHALRLEGGGPAAGSLVQLGRAHLAAVAAAHLHEGHPRGVAEGSLSQDLSDAYAHGARPPRRRGRVNHEGRERRY